MKLWGYRGDNKKIYISKSVYSSVTERYPFLREESPTIIHYGLPRGQPVLDLPRSADSDDTIQPFILMVGRLDPDKNYDEALQIYKKLQIKLKNATPSLLIIGQDDYRLSEKYCFSSITGVKYLGALPNHLVLTYMRHAKLFLFCSRNEGLGLALLEAMSQGTIVLARNTGAFPELIDDGVNGYLYNPINLDLAVQKITSILNMSASQLQHIRDNAYNRIKSKHMIQEYSRKIASSLKKV